MTKRENATQSQKLMVFVLTMSLYGLATLFTELIPSIQVGIVEFSVEYFLFIPLVLAMLFDPMSAALGAATGELVFSEIMLGQVRRTGRAGEIHHSDDRCVHCGENGARPQKPENGGNRSYQRRYHPAGAGA